MKYLGIKKKKRNNTIRGGLEIKAMSNWWQKIERIIVTFGVFLVILTLVGILCIAFFGKVKDMKKQQININVNV